MTDWASVQKHRKQALEDSGRWACLLDGDFEFLCDLPAFVEFSLPDTRNAVGDCEVSIPVFVDGELHPVVDDLVATGFIGGSFDGRVEPVVNRTRVVVFESVDGGRCSFRVVKVQAVGDSRNPHTLLLQGVSMLDYLAGLPAPSMLGTWKSNVKSVDRDYAAVFNKSRLLGDIRFSNVADGFTEVGPAETVIRRVIEQSVDATNRVLGVLVADSHIRVCPYGSGLPSPTAWVRPTDDYLFDTIVGTAASAGVVVSADLWIPGDPQPLGLTLSSPCVVVSVRQGVVE